MIRRTTNLSLTLLLVLQFLVCTGCSSDVDVEEERASPSERIDDVERRNEDLFKEMDW